MEKDLLPAIEKRIYTIRGQQVMFDRDLANLYGVPSKALNQAVKRNAERFPDEFMFQLDPQEFAHWKSQIVTSKGDAMGLRKRSHVFTEQGIAMLSAVIRSAIAIDVSIRIMNAFVALRRQYAASQVYDARFRIIETAISRHEKKFDQLFNKFESNKIPSQGIFFQNQLFDAYAFFNDLVMGAKFAIILIDNYIDHTVLLQLAKRKEGVTATIYTAGISASLRLDLEKHNDQYPPIEIRRIQHVHDRFLLIDGKELYHIGASIKDLGKKWFAFSRMDSLAKELERKLGDKHT
jgi:hypothetical protein